jgi:hypothetical protein
MPPPPRALPEEVVEEILLRLPPHKPAYLVRASVVSKPWLALVSGISLPLKYAIKSLCCLDLWRATILFSSTRNLGFTR